MDKALEHYKKMTETKVSHLVIMLGIPTIIATLISNIYNLADTYFVGTLGISEQASTGIVFTLQCILQAIGFMLGHGAGAYVSKCEADKDTKEASKYVSTSFFLAFFIGLIVLIFGLIFIKPLMKSLGSSDTVLPYAILYSRWIILASPFFVSSLVLNNNLRYEGKAFYAMIGIGSGAIINIFLDYLFIMKLNMGVNGAGLATFIGQTTSWLLMLIFYKFKAQSVIRIKYIFTNYKRYLEIFSAGFPSLLRQGLNAISNGVLNNIVRPYGDEAIAAISIVNKFTNFVGSVGLGIGQGFQPVSAFNYQAKKYKRVKSGLIFTLVFATLLVSVFALSGIIVPEKIIWLFQKDNDVIKVGTFALRVGAIGCLFMPTCICANMLYQSIRHSITASLLASLRSGATFLPILLIMAYSTNLGFNGIALAQPLGAILAAIISAPFIIYFIKKTPNDPSD